MMTCWYKVDLYIQNQFSSLSMSVSLWRPFHLDPLFFFALNITFDDFSTIITPRIWLKTTPRWWWFTMWWGSKQYLLIFLIYLTTYLRHSLFYLFISVLHHIEPCLYLRRNSVCGKMQGNILIRLPVNHRANLDSPVLHIFGNRLTTLGKPQATQNSTQTGLSYYSSKTSKWTAASYKLNLQCRLISLYNS